MLDTLLTTVGIGMLLSGIALLSMTAFSLARLRQKSPACDEDGEDEQYV